MAQAAASPLSAVLSCVREGARTLAEIQLRTGLSAEMVRTAIDHLVRTHRLIVRNLAMGCAGGSCGDCSVADGCGTGDGAPSLRELVLAPRFV